MYVSSNVCNYSFHVQIGKTNQYESTQTYIHTHIQIYRLREIQKMIQK